MTRSHDTQATRRLEKAVAEGARGRALWALIAPEIRKHEMGVREDLRRIQERREDG